MCGEWGRKNNQEWLRFWGWETGWIVVTFIEIENALRKTQFFREIGIESSIVNMVSWDTLRQLSGDFK